MGISEDRKTEMAECSARDVFCDQRPILRAAEPGQAIIIIALLLVVLLGLVALAIDGGDLYLLHRKAANAADAASIAAAYARCTGGDYDLAAEQAAARNGFDASAIDLVITNAADGTMYTEAIVTAEKPKYFAQVIYDGPLTVHARSEAFCRQEGGGAPGNNYALYAGSNCSDALNIPADRIDIFGNLHSEGGLILTGEGSDIWGIGTYEGALVFTANNVEFNGEACDAAASPPCGDSLLDYSDDYACEEPITYPLPWNITDFYPGGAIAQAAAAQGHYHTPSDPDRVISDKNPNKWLQEQGLLTCQGQKCKLACGIYYSKAGIDITSRIELADPDCGVTFISDGTIYLRHEQSSITGTYVEDLLAFSNYGYDPFEACNCSNPAELAVELSLDSTLWTGNVFAPFGHIFANGDNNVGVNGCLIGYEVTVSGDSININCEASDAPASYIIQYSR